MPGVVRFFRGSILLGTAQTDGETTLAELAENSRVDVPTNCTSGTCGTCMVRLISGDLPLPEELPPGLDEYLVEEGARLACIAVPVSDVDIDTIPPI